MPDEVERRRVAQAFREMETPTWPTLTEAVMGHAATREKVVERLADLIEPVMTTDTTKNAQDTTKCDRDALLALADEMERKASDWDVAQGDIPFVHAGYLMGYADSIREALGVES